MKLAIGTALLVLLLGTTTYAQEQDKEKDKPAQQEQKNQEPAAKEHPQAQEQHKAQEQQQKAQQHEAQEQQKNQSKEVEKEKSDAAKQQQAAHQQQQTEKQQQVAKQQQQQQVARQEHTQNQQAQRDGGNRNSRRISEQDFHQHFGREHTFRVSRSNDRRFNYGGYYWVYNEPWPSDWAYSDDVYVDEIDGEYYLIDPGHPGVRLLIVVAD